MSPGDLITAVRPVIEAGGVLGATLTRVWGPACRITILHCLLKTAKRVDCTCSHHRKKTVTCEVVR